MQEPQQHLSLLSDFFEFKVSCFPKVKRHRRSELLGSKLSTKSEIEVLLIPLEQPARIPHRNPSESMKNTTKYRKILHDNRKANRKRLAEHGNLLTTQLNIKQTLRLLAQSAEPTGRSNSLFLERKMTRNNKLLAFQDGDSGSRIIDFKEKPRASLDAEKALDILTVTKLRGHDLKQQHRTRAKFFMNAPQRPILKYRPSHADSKVPTSSLIRRSFSKEQSSNKRSYQIKQNSSDISSAVIERKETELSVRFLEDCFEPNIQQEEPLPFALKEGISGHAFTVLHCKGEKYRLLTQQNNREKLEFASLTKIMTCLLVLLVGERLKMDLKKQRTKVSHRAASLKGTTARLETSDNMSVEDLMHGMMLPSGNDAAMALAEWGGKTIRHHYRQGSESQSPRKAKCTNISESLKRSNAGLFIFHMNCVAKKLGMTSTRFANCHGLMNKRNYSCTDDLSRLCLFAMQRSDFAEIVGRNTYTCTVSNARFLAQRTLTWNNTNKLLKLEGTRGIKTGITPSAGSCLASCFELSPNENIYVVLLKTLTVQHRFEESKQLLVEALRWLHRSTSNRIYLERLQSITNQNLEQLPEDSNEDSNNFEPPSENDDVFEEESQICDINIEL